MIMNCCTHTHPYDRFDVQGSWQPPELRCLIVGENPGGPKSAYFYDPPGSYEDDPVDVRYALLQNLSGQKLLSPAILEGFREAGFLFDHAIRCPIPRNEFRAEMVKNPEHLRETLAHAPIVWVMGHWACKAVANLTNTFPKKKYPLTESPYSWEIDKFFISAYLTKRKYKWNNPEEIWPRIFSAFAHFVERKVGAGKGI